MNVSPQLFAILSGIVEERAGLHYRLSDHELFLDKVNSRGTELGFESLLDYYYYLRYDDQGSRELDSLIDHLVVNETYFFRESEPVEVLLDDLIGPRIACGQRPRIWSAACSTGEEPLTLAMLLAERGWLDRVQLVASDVSSKALGRARVGEFNPRALRGPAPPAARKWLTNGTGVLRCADQLVQAISWRRVNLIEPAQVAELGQFDAILCRNVLIYFDDRTIQRVVCNLTERLRPDGALLVGVSESLLRFATALECREVGGTFLYVKPDPEAATSAAGEPARAGTRRP